MNALTSAYINNMREFLAEEVRTQSYLKITSLLIQLVEKSIFISAELFTIPK